MDGRTSGRAASSLIEYVCAAPGHAYVRQKDGDHLTIHQKAWAFCGADVRKAGHEWRPTGGIELLALVGGLRSRDPVESSA